MNQQILDIVRQNERIRNLYEIGPVQQAEVEQFAEDLLIIARNIVLNGLYDEEEFNPADPWHQGHNQALINVAEGIKNYFELRV
jgi:hypothetical protein